MTPETKYADSGGVSIAYQVLGEGPPDLVFVPGFASNLDIYWEEPAVERFYLQLASFSRLILFDKRGTGLSDRLADLPSLEVRMDDVRAVMDAVGSERAALFGASEGGPMCALFAATNPHRTSALIMVGSYARNLIAPDYPFGRSEELMQAMYDDIERNWGKPIGVRMRAPSMAGDERFCQWWGRLLRMSASRSSAIALHRMNAQIDIRAVLPTINVPTLILHSARDKSLHVGLGRYLADHIRAAKFVELQGSDHVPYLSDAGVICGEVEEFLTGVRHDSVTDRVLTTVLFTDIVGATEKASTIGDARWRQLLASHHDAVRREIARFRGREIDTAGDGFFAAFDGPARAVRCACAVSDAVRSLGIELRAGVHTGECEVMGDKYGGIAVHIGARIAALAAAGEVLVSNTVKDLVAGSGLAFDDGGVQPLKGVPGEWHLFRVLR